MSNSVDIIVRVLEKGTAATFNSLKNGLKTSELAIDVFRQKMKSMNVATADFSTRMQQLIGVIGAGFAGQKLASSIIGFNSTLEQSQIGLAALVRTFNEFPEGTDKYNASVKVATDIQKQLQVAGLETTATYEELLKALQEGIGPAFARGFDPSQIVQFTTMMVQAAAAISLPMDQLGQEIRSILDATIDRNSRVAKALGITNEKVKEMAANGRLFDYLKGKLGEFAKAGEESAKTWQGAWSNLIDAVQMALGQGFESAFTKMKTLFLDIKDAIVTVDKEAGTFSFNPKIIAAIEQANAAVTDFIGSISKDDISRYLGIISETISGLVSVLMGFLDTLKTFADYAGGSIPILAKLTAGFVLWGGALKLIIGLPLTIAKQLWALVTAFEATFGLKIGAWLVSVREGLTFAEIAAGGLKSVLGGLAGVLGAALVGWEIGTLLNQFDTVKKSGILMAEGLTLAWLSAKKAWLEFRNKDTSGIEKEIADAKKIYGEMYDEVSKKATDAANKQQSAANKAASSSTKAAGIMARTFAEATEEMKKKYEEFGRQVADINNDIAGRTQSLAEQLREMGRSGMSDLGAWRDRRAEAEEFADAAAQAAEEAKKAFAAGDTATGTAKAEQAVSLYDKAREAAAGLNTEIKDGDTVIQSQQQSLKIAKDMVEEYGTAAIEVQKQLKQAVQETAQALDKQSGFALSRELPEVAKQFGDLQGKANDLQASSNAFGVAWLQTWHDFLSSGDESIATLESKLRELTKDRTVTVYVREVAANYFGGLVNRLHSGGFPRRSGKLPGSDGPDSIRALLAPGEFIIRSAAVRHYGAALFHALNTMRLNAGSMIRERMADHVSRIVVPSPVSPVAMFSGGEIGAPAAAGNNSWLSLTANIYGKTGTSELSARKNGRAMLKEFERQHRRRS